ncbi:MAG: hypothetical protein ACM3KR_02565 [Deltaproteobacteria bacterium]
MEDNIESLNSHLQAKKLLERIQEKITQSSETSVITETAPDAYIAELVLIQLKANGYKVSRYENILSVPTN